jgi:hypothetical protein
MVDIFEATLAYTGTSNPVDVWHAYVLRGEEEEGSSVHNVAGLLFVLHCKYMTCQSGMERKTHFSLLESQGSFVVVVFRHRREPPSKILKRTHLIRPSCSPLKIFLLKVGDSTLATTLSLSHSLDDLALRSKEVNHIIAG